MGTVDGNRRIMNVTVILCTYNRCGDLAKTLDSLASSTLPSSVAWEVLVVDNNSNDQTRDVALDFCRRYPNRFRYLFEPHPGKSYALNSGIREAHGEILAFTDDDLIVDTTWLHNLTIPFGNGAWAGVGGRTLLEQGFSPPHWLALNGWYGMGGILALCDFGDKARELDWPPYGANMAFRKKMFEKYGGFRTDLGPTPDGKIPRPNEDTEFGRRLMAAGERLWYEPSAVVHHPVPEKRLKKSYFLAWWFDYGRALIREKGKRPHLYGIPRHHLSIPTMIGTRMPVDMLRWVLTWDPQRRFFWKSRVWLTAGAVVEAYRVARDANERNEQK
jgi:glucosyl-dolichyl phosphate glucuronosyltransferase